MDFMGSQQLALTEITLTSLLSVLKVVTGQLLENEPCKDASFMGQSSHSLEMTSPCFPLSSLLGT